MADELKMPEVTRIRMLGLYQAMITAQNTFNGQMGTVFEMVGLDPNGQHGVNFDTGVITPNASGAPVQPDALPVEETKKGEDEASLPKPIPMSRQQRKRALAVVGEAT